MPGRGIALETATAVAALALVGATWPLWLPPGPFPQVPLFSWAVFAPAWCDQCGLAALIAGLFAVLTARGLAVFGLIGTAKTLHPTPPAPPSEGGERTNPAGAKRLDVLRIAGWCAFLLAATAMVVLDQHRWQAWLWQFAVLAVVFVAAPADRVIPLARVLAVSVYLHSAIGKLDRSFVDTHGSQLVAALLEVLGAEARSSRLQSAALALPLGELLIGLGLCIPRLRSASLVVSVLMHATLIVFLGPLGLNHKPGVLLWNAYFIVHNLIVFGGARHTGCESIAAKAARAQRSPPSPLPFSPRTAGGRGVFQGTRFSRLVDGVVWVAAVLPILAPFGLLDPWLGWGVYASRPARLRMYVAESAVARLPATLQRHVEPAAPLDDWRRVRIDRWSLDVTSAPISPQVRFQLGVARAIIRDAGLAVTDVRIDLESAASLWTGRRTSRVLTDAAAIERAAGEFRWNANPRPQP